MRKTILVFILSCGFLVAADNKPVVYPTFQYGPYTATIHDVRLNMKAHTLEVQGTLQLTERKAKKFKYVIDPEAATMRQGKETRHFIPEEAKFLHSIYDWLVTYAAESGVWWAVGLGSDKPIPDQSPNAPLKKGDGKNVVQTNVPNMRQSRADARN